MLWPSNHAMIPLIPPIALPAIGALVAALLGRHERVRLLPARKVGWLLAAFPAASLLIQLAVLPGVLAGQQMVLRVEGMPSLGVEFALLLDGLSLLFTMLVAGLGALILIYSGYYLEKDPEIWRFWSLLLAFMSAMLGLLLAYDGLLQGESRYLDVAIGLAALGFVAGVALSRYVVDERVYQL